MKYHSRIKLIVFILLLFGCSKAHHYTFSYVIDNKSTVKINIIGKDYIGRDVILFIDPGQSLKQNLVSGVERKGEISDSLAFGKDSVLLIFNNTDTVKHFNDYEATHLGKFLNRASERCVFNTKAYEHTLSKGKNYEYKIITYTVKQSDYDFDKQ